MSLFQIILTGVFIFFIVFAVLVFSGIIPLFTTAPSGVGGTVTLWGTLPADYFSQSLAELNKQNEKLFTVKYIEKQEGTFDQELVEAIASGKGPDMLLLPQDLIVRYEDKVVPLPYTSLSVRDFRDAFIEEGELYLTNAGILALPFSIDPLVLFWNRDIFNAQSVSKPPAFWDQFLVLAPRFTSKDESFTIHQSTIALGEFGNVEHAKDILSLLVLQAGNPIVERGENGLSGVLDERRGFVTSPAESSLRFYTQFSNPAQPIYSWNRALPSSKDFFIANSLAAYVGYASEVRELSRRSSNLNFDVALIPQAREMPAKITFGKMTGVATLKSSKNLKTALFVAALLSGRSFIDIFSHESGLPPVRRDLLAVKTTGNLGEVFNGSALIAKGWLDPSPVGTSLIFRKMVETITSNRETIENAVSRANGELNALLQAR